LFIAKSATFSVDTLRQATYLSINDIMKYYDNISVFSQNIKWKVEQKQLGTERINKCRWS